MRNMISKRAEEIPSSGIRRFFSLANEIEDSLSLGIGEPDFNTSMEVRNKAIEKIQQGITSYTPNAGLPELRELVSEYLFKRMGVLYEPETEMIITTGSCQALDIAIRGTINPEDEVLIIEPTYVAYKPLIELCGGVPVVVDTKGNDFRLDMKQLEKK